MDMQVIKKIILARDKRHKLAADEYERSLAALLRAERIERLRQLKERSISIAIDPALASHEDGLRGFTVDRAHLPGVQEYEQVVLARLPDENSCPAGGPKQAVVRQVDATSVKIRLNEPLKLTSAKSPLPQPAEGEEAKTEAEAAAKGGTHRESQNVEAIPTSERGVLAAKRQAAVGKEPKSDNPKSQLQEADSGAVDCEKDTKEQQVDVEPVEAEIQPPCKFRLNFNTTNIEEQVGCISRALSRFRKIPCSLMIYKCLLGNYNEQNEVKYDKVRPMSSLAGPIGLVSLNELQRLAVEQSMRKRISLIEGPAGSGKTLVAAHIACNMSRVRKRKVLLCSPLETNARQLANLIHSSVAAGLSVVELPAGRPLKRPSIKRMLTVNGKSSHSSSSPAISSRLSTTTSILAHQEDDEEGEEADGEESCDCSPRQLDALVDAAIYRETHERQRRLYEAHRPEVFEAHLARVVANCSPWRRRKIEQKILNSADVICCSLVQAGSYLLEGIRRDMLIVDDAQVATELECIVPLLAVKGIKQVTLISDMRREIRLARSTSRTSQLGPEANHYSQNSNNKINHHNQKQVQSKAEMANANHFHEANHRPSSVTSAPVTPVATLRRRQRNYNNRRRKEGAADHNRLKMPLLATGPITPLDWKPSQHFGGLFERWLSLGLSAVALRHQFRTHEPLANFTNHHFYLGRLKASPSVGLRLTKEVQKMLIARGESSFQWLPNRLCLTAFCDSACKPPQPDDGDHHDGHISDALYDLVNRLVVQEGIPAGRLGVIVNVHTRLRLPAAAARVSLGTIEQFIGQQRDFIVLVGFESTSPMSSSASSIINQDNSPAGDSSVAPPTASVDNGVVLNTRGSWSSSRINHDFLRHDGALNVALTRPRLGLFIVGQLNPISRDSSSTTTSMATTTINSLISSKENYIPSRHCQSWRELVKYYIHNKLVI